METKTGMYKKERKMLDFGFYNMDCMEGMKEFPDKYFDLAIVDPPYGINADKFSNGSGFQGRGDSTAKRIRKATLGQGAGKLKNIALQKYDTSWDAKPPGKEYFEELFRVSKNQIIWGGNYFDLPPTRGIIAWDKEQVWENFSQFELAWTSFNMPAKIFRYRNHGSASGGKIHPTQKPITLYEWLLSVYAKKGYKILDTHVGSASSLIACRNYGYKYVGFEKDQNYFDSAEKRLEEHSSQMNLYDYIDNEGKKYTQEEMLSYTE